MKKIVIVLLYSFVLFGCKSNDMEREKNNYLNLRDELIEKVEFSSLEDINFDLNISIDRINEEEISYRAIIDNPKENMYNVRALVVHDSITDEIFPSLGIFDEDVDLILGDDKIKGISLIGYIKNSNDIEEIDLNIRVYIEYVNENNELVKIYYKTTN